MLEIQVIGKPAPQGSKSFKGMRRSKKTGAMVPVLAESSEEAVNSWRASVAWSAHHAIVNAGMRYPNNKPAVPGCVHLHIVFTMPRPKSARPGSFPGVAPDLSKLLRATEDALTDARAWEDDSRVVSTVMKKLYEGDIERGALHIPGAFIRIKGVYEE